MWSDIRVARTKLVSTGEDFTLRERKVVCRVYPPQVFTGRWSGFNAQQPAGQSCVVQPAANRIEARW
jgi:hypothetical protein